MIYATALFWQLKTHFDVFWVEKNNIVPSMAILGEMTLTIIAMKKALAVTKVSFCIWKTEDSEKKTVHSICTKCLLLFASLDI